MSKEGKLDKKANQLLEENYLCVYVDTEHIAGKQLAAEFEMKKGPGLIISNADGSLQAFRHEGTLSNSQLVQELRRLADPNLVVRETEFSTTHSQQVSYYSPEGSGSEVSANLDPAPEVTTSATVVFPATAVEEGRRPFLRWRRNYSAAMREARNRGRIVVVDIGTTGCMWCQKMEATTFQDQQIVGVVNQKAVPLKIDAQEEEAIARELKVQRYPTLILASPEGKILDFMEGYVDPDTFSDHLKRALAQTPQADEGVE
ncbi:MAG: thioredoxin family protein [Planctomycetes bacterium]|nr:thioredoxin family protein [Planctomycetota bacterium]